MEKAGEEAQQGHGPSWSLIPPDLPPPPGYCIKVGSVSRCGSRELPFVLPWQWVMAVRRLSQDCQKGSTSAVSQALCLSDLIPWLYLSLPMYNLKGFDLGQVMASHSSTLAWKIPWTEEPGRLQSMGLLRVGHDWVTSLSLFTFMHWRRKWQPTPVFLPGESQGRGSLLGCRLWGRTESDTTEAT